MGLFDALMGRSKPTKPKLDNLFAIAGAALTLEAATDFIPTGVGVVGFRTMQGGAMASAEAESRALIESDPATTVRQENDEYGYTWQVIADANRDMTNLATNIHAVNMALEAQGFGPMLLSSAVYFRNSANQRLALVYLYKRGTFYPFVQTGPQQRDTPAEMNIRAVIGADLPFEDDMGKWSPLWNAPGINDTVADS